MKREEAGGEREGEQMRGEGARKREWEREWEFRRCEEGKWGSWREKDFHRRREMGEERRGEKRVG